jgi:transcription elongation factor GreA
MLRKYINKVDNGPVHLTQDGLLRMEHRLAELKASLPALIAEAGRTAAEGDRSENDAYKQSKSLLRRTHRQIWTIEDQLKRVVLIKTGHNASGIIQLGSTVVLEGDNQTRRTFEIVGPRETNPGRGRISHVSPLGAALVGHTKDDTITVRSLDGDRNYKILEIK